MSKRTTWTNSRDLIGAIWLLPFGIALSAAPTLQAQAVSFTGVQTTIPATGLNFPTGVAANAAGDVFVADEINNRVLRISATGVQTEVATELKLPHGLALDGAGNLFITDTFNNRVLKYSTSGVLTTVVSGLNRPMGVAPGAANSLYLADAYNNRVIRVSSNGTLTVVASGLNRPAGVAVDQTGNVFIADTGNNRVIKISTDGAQSLITQYVAQPYGVAADSAGNVFIADTNNSRVLKIAPNGAMTTVNGSVRYPYGVAVDEAGSLFIADSNHDRMVQQQLTSVNFGNVNVCPAGQSTPAPCSRTYTLSFYLTNTVNFGNPTVYTQGGSDLDFKLDGSTCTGTVTAGGSCTATVTFTPLAPGARLGGFELIDAAAGGKVLSSTSVYGQGQGSAISFGPGTPVTVASGLNSATGIAVDGAGNMFIADFMAGQVLKVAPGGTQTTVGAGLRFPAGVAVDGAGNVFIADTGNGRVVKVQARDGHQTTLIAGLSLPQSLAVDGAGNVFIADYGNNRVLKIAAATGLQAVVGSDVGLKLPYGVALDGAGYVYIVDYGNDRVVKVSPRNTFDLVAKGLNHPTAVAVNAAGSVFITDTFNDRVLEVPANGFPPTTVATGLARPQGVAVDGVGNIYISDTNNHRILNVQRSTPPALVFTPILAGNVSGPQTVTITSIGNQQLSAVLPGLTMGDSFLQSPGGTWPACKATFNMKPGERCDLSISFAPKTGGSFQSTAVLTDNALNSAPGMQTINLSGTGMLPTTTSALAASGVYSDPVTLNAVVTGPVGLTFAGTLQFRVEGAPPICSVAVTGSGTYSCVYIIGNSVGKRSVMATFTPSDWKLQGSTGTNTLTVGSEDATVTPSSMNPTTAKVSSNGTANVTFKGTVSESNDGSLGNRNRAVISVTMSGPSSVTCSVTNQSGFLTASCPNLRVGAYSLTWTIGGDYQGPSVSSTFTVTQ